MIPIDTKIGTKVAKQKYFKVVIIYLGPGYSDETFSGRVVDSDSPYGSHDVGKEANDWSRSEFELGKGRWL